jgi:hypothetical protein
LAIGGIYKLKKKKIFFFVLSEFAFFSILAKSHTFVFVNDDFLCLAFSINNIRSHGHDFSEKTLLLSFNGTRVRCLCQFVLRYEIKLLRAKNIN